MRALLETFGFGAFRLEVISRVASFKTRDFRPRPRRDGGQNFSFVARRLFFSRQEHAEYEKKKKKTPSLKIVLKPSVQTVYYIVRVEIDF